MRVVHSILLLATLASPPAMAATYCVGSPDELQQALYAAAASTADDEIRLKPGLYMGASTFWYTSNNAGWLFVTGGWETFNGSPCGRQSASADTTVLDGQGQHRVLGLALFPPEPSPVIVRVGVGNLTLRNGVGEGYNRGGGLLVQSTTTVHTEVWLDNLIVRDNSGYFAGGADIYLRNGLLRIINSLFHRNSAPTSAGAHVAITLIEGAAATDVVIASSTFVDGRCPGQDVRGCGVLAGLGGSVHLQILNSLFWGNAIADVTLEGLPLSGMGSGTAQYAWSRVPVTTGGIVPAQQDGLLLDPRFVDPDADNFRLADDSPYIDRAHATIPVYPHQAFYDLDAQPRLRFAAQDAGAYENQTSPFVFRDGFD